MDHTPADYGWLLIGAIIISIGAGLAGIYSFQGQFIPVAVGFGLFCIGFKLSQIGVYQWPQKRIRDVLSAEVTKIERWTLMKRGSALTVGPLLIAGGVTLFSQTILEPALYYAITAGVVTITGYMISHYGMVGRLL